MQTPTLFFGYNGGFLLLGLMETTIEFWKARKVPKTFQPLLAAWLSGSPLHEVCTSVSISSFVEYFCIYVVKGGEDVQFSLFSKIIEEMKCSEEMEKKISALVEENLRIAEIVDIIHNRKFSKSSLYDFVKVCRVRAYWIKEQSCLQEAV